MTGALGEGDNVLGTGRDGARHESVCRHRLQHDQCAVGVVVRNLLYEREGRVAPMGAGKKHNIDWLSLDHVEKRIQPLDDPGFAVGL